MMNDETLDRLICTSFTAFCDEYIDLTPDMNKPHVFPKDYDKRIKRFFDEPRRAVSGATGNVRLKRAILIAIAAVLTATILVFGAVASRGSFSGFRVVDMNDHSRLIFDNPSSLTEIESNYTLSGITMLACDSTGVFCNSDYDVNGETVFLSQSLAIRSNWVNTECCETERIVEDDTEYLHVYNDRYNWLYWRDGDYLFELYGEITCEQLLALTSNLIAI